MSISAPGVNERKERRGEDHSSIVLLRITQLRTGEGVGSGEGGDCGGGRSEEGEQRRRLDNLLILPPPKSTDIARNKTERKAFQNSVIAFRSHVPDRVAWGWELGSSINEEIMGGGGKGEG